MDNLDQKHYYHFLAPKHWGLWLSFLLLRLVTLLPYFMIRKLANFLGNLLYHIMKKRVHIARVNLSLCFPEKNAQQREQLLKENMCQIAMGMFELALAWWATDKRIERLVDIKNTDCIVDGLKRGVGLIGITAHFTSLELMTRALSQKIPPGAGIYRRQKNDLFEWISRKKRQKWNLKMIDRLDIKGFLSALNRNMPIAYLPDHDYGTKYAAFVPFFGVPAATISILGTLLRKKKSPVVTFYMHYKKGNKKPYELDCFALKEDYPSQDMVKDAAYVNQVLESVIRRHPEQYMWQHRRFKNRPEGEAYPY